MRRNRAIPLAIVSACILLVVLLGGVLRASASVAPFVRYQQTYSVGLINDLPTIRGAQPGMIAACAENGKAYVAQPSAAYTVSPPRVVAGYAGDGIVWVDFLTVASPITSSFIGSITWGQIVPSSIPSTLAGHSITDGVTISRSITASSSGPITVNSGTSTTLAGDVALGFNWGSPVGVLPGGANSAGISASAARADHVHTVPVGTTSGTVAAGDDSRLSNDRVASGLRSATTVVSVSSATAPSQYQVLMGNSSTSASWQFIGNGSVIDNSLSPGKLTLGGANQLFVSNGTANLWSSMTDTLHGNRGGGALHGTASTSTNGFMSSVDKTRADAVYAASLLTLNDHSAALPASYRLGVNGTQSNNVLVMGAVAANTADISAHFVGNLYDGVAPRITGSNRVLLSSNGTSSSWGAITDSYITGPIGWGKIGSTPTTLSGYGITDATPSSRIISATAPLRIDGGASANLSANRALSISAASGSAAGSMSALHYTRLEKIPDPTTDKMGYILTPSGLSETYTLQPPANMGILTTTTGISGSGSAGYIPKFTSTRIVGNSRLHENATGIGIGTEATAYLDLLGSNGNTSFRIRDSSSPYADFAIVSSPRNGAANGLFWIYNEPRNAIPFAIHDTGNVGISTIDPTATLDVNGTFRLRGGSPAAGKLIVANDNLGNAIWTSDITGLTSLVFAAGATAPIVTQTERTGTYAVPLTIEAGSTNDSNWYTWSGDLRLNAGTSGSGAKGNVLFGYRNNPGAFGYFGASGATVHGAVTADANITTSNPSGGLMDVTNVAPFDIDESIQWDRVTSTDGNAASIYITSLRGGQLPRNKAYSAKITAMAVNSQGFIGTATDVATFFVTSDGTVPLLSWYSQGKTDRIAIGYYTVSNGVQISLTYVAGSGTTTWTVKSVITRL